MDPFPRTSGALLDRAGADVAQLLKRFENVVGLAPMSAREGDGDGDGEGKSGVKSGAGGAGGGRTRTAVEVYQIEVETAALIRAAESLLSLTRSLKEAWLFGTLKTLGTEESTRKAEGKMDEDVRGVAEGLERLIRGGGGGSGGGG
ncbi:hypothetical protein MMC16_001621 [Acarospora aff. strigata]|nr:hypothetical protein [Acarospora aff. strigata]